MVMVNNSNLINNMIAPSQYDYPIDGSTDSIRQGSQAGVNKTGSISKTQQQA
jgi:hypothetical protein